MDNLTQQELDALRERFEAEMTRYETDLDEDELLNLQAPTSIRKVLALLDELTEQQERADKLAKRVKALEASGDAALDMLRRLKRNIDESEPLPKYDGAAVEAVIHALSLDNPKLRAAGKGA